MTISNNEIRDYLKRVDVLVEILHKQKIINRSDRSLFFTQIMGVSPMIYKNWYSQGIRKIYKQHLSLLEEKYINVLIPDYSKEQLYKHNDN